MEQLMAGTERLERRIAGLEPARMNGKERAAFAAWNEKRY